MDNKPLLWVLGGGAFAFTAVVAYWIFAITLANQLKSDQVSPQKAAEFIHAILEANRNNYTDNVVVKLSRDGIEAHVYVARIDATLLEASGKRALSKYIGFGKATGQEDRGPINLAVQAALNDLFGKIENDQRLRKYRL